MNSCLVSEPDWEGQHSQRTNQGLRGGFLEKVKEFLAVVISEEAESLISVDYRWTI
ncbi:hypothetical protein J6590_018503 [Homalodisca vitripennis]|nr:hypothetical protein J6590_018503 [Homalodisca vitripennis]